MRIAPEVLSEELGLRQEGAPGWRGRMTKRSPPLLQYKIIRLAVIDTVRYRRDEFVFV